LECDGGERFEARVRKQMRRKPVEKDKEQVPIN
jgi:hypothetical protein